MSTKYPGGLITKTPVTPAGPYQSGAASGVWTLDQQLQYTKQGIWPIAGNTPPYIEDVFSTYLYTGTGATQTITNNINLSANGGLVWTACRSNAYGQIRQTAPGTYLDQTTAAAAADGSGNFITAFNSTGFTIGDGTAINNSGSTFVSWTFRKQAKFFDVVTYTGDGTDPRTISHNLGSTPGCIIIKCTSNTTNWATYHRYDGTGGVALNINTTASSGQATTIDNGYIDVGTSSTTSTYFTVTAGGAGTTGRQNVNASGYTYVAYLFAHNAGGFGAAGTDNVISCGSFTLDGSNTAIVTLGYEPQWVMIKRTNSTGNWIILDNMRGLTTSGVDAALRANTSGAETNGQEGIYPTATGFGANTGLSSSGDNYIYIAIRRGPMKTPTTGTSIFDIQQYTGTQSSSPGVARNITTTIRSDVNITSAKTPGYDIGVFFDRLRGCNKYIGSNSTNSEGTMPGSAAYEFWNDKYILGGYYLDYTGYQYVNYSLQRAPGFFDEVCYTGTGTDNRQVTHNLGVTPELIINKNRGAAWPWWVGGSVLGSTQYGLYLNDTSAKQTNARAFATAGAVFTSSYFLVSSVSAYPPNANGYANVAYLFATLAGVSKVGSYTGTGTLTTINCGFTGGARFVLIKRTDSTSDWFVWDTARGMVSGTDPSLSLNTSSAESNANSVYTATTGFQLLASPSADVNTNAATYIFLAIA